MNKIMYKYVHRRFGNCWCTNFEKLKVHNPHEMDMKYIFPIQVYRIYFSKKIHSAVIIKTKKNCAYIVVLYVALYMTQLVSIAAQD